MMRLALAFFLSGCAIPTLSSVGAVDDAGACNVVVVPGSCADVPDYEARLDRLLPCNTCVDVVCACRPHIFCKLCTVASPSEWTLAENETAWGCMIPPYGEQRSWCVDDLP